jgi:glyoxylase I family protein
MHIDHFTIRTRDLAATKAFLINVFDLEERARPAAIQRIPGHWLYSGAHPLVHLILGYGEGADRAAETIDHVGIRLEGYAAFRARLERLGVNYSLMDLPELDERRVFFRAPGGTLLEAVFTEPMPAAAA